MRTRSKRLSGPILQYPGGKWKLAPQIISHFPQHEVYIEPFFGGGSILFNKPISPYEIVNDLSGDIVNLFKVIRDQGIELARQIELTPYARDEYKLSMESTSDPLERARRFIVRVWMSHTSKINEDPGWRHGRAGHTQAWNNVHGRVAEVCKRLKLVEIENKDAITIIKTNKRPNALIYADPPYVRSTRQSDMYQHEMSDSNHVELIEVLDAHLGPVVLSGYRCQLYDDMLTHWTRVDIPNHASSGARRLESLWLNAAASGGYQSSMNI